jgi:hypothetical protein
MFFSRSRARGVYGVTMTPARNGISFSFQTSSGNFNLRDSVVQNGNFEQPPAAAPAPPPAAAPAPPPAAPPAPPPAAAPAPPPAAASSGRRRSTRSTGCPIGHYRDCEHSDCTDDETHFNPEKKPRTSEYEVVNVANDPAAPTNELLQLPPPSLCTSSLEEFNRHYVEGRMSISNDSYESRRKPSIAYLFPFVDELQKCVILHSKFVFNSMYETEHIEKLNSVFAAEERMSREPFSHFATTPGFVKLSVPLRSAAFTLTHAQRISTLHIAGVSFVLTTDTPAARSCLSPKLHPEWVEELHKIWKRDNPSVRISPFRKIGGLNAARSAPARPSHQILVSPAGTGKRTVAACAVITILCSANWHSFSAEAEQRRHMSAYIESDSENAHFARIAVVFAPNSRREQWEEAFKGLLSTKDCSGEGGSFAVHEGSGWTLAKVSGVAQVKAAFRAYRDKGGAHILVIESSFGLASAIEVSRQMDFPSVFVYASGTGAISGCNTQTKPALSLFVASSFRELCIDIQKSDVHPLRRSLGLSSRSAAKDLEFACSVANAFSSAMPTEVEINLKRQMSLRLAMGPPALALMRIADAIPLMPEFSRCFDLKFEGSVDADLAASEGIFDDFVGYARRMIGVVTEHYPWYAKELENSEWYVELAKVLKTSGPVLCTLFEKSFESGMGSLQKVCNALRCPIENYHSQSDAVREFWGFLGKAALLPEPTEKSTCSVCLGSVVEQDLVGSYYIPRSMGLTACCAHPLCDSCYKELKRSSGNSCPTCRATDKFSVVGVLSQKQQPPSNEVCDKYLLGPTVPENESGDGAFDRLCQAACLRPSCLHYTVDLAVAAALRSSCTSNPRILVLSELNPPIGVVEQNRIDYLTLESRSNCEAAHVAAQQAIARFSSLPGPRVLHVSCNHRENLVKVAHSATAVVAVEPSGWFANSIQELMTMGRARNRPVLRIFRVTKA